MITKEINLWETRHEDGSITRGPHKGQQKVLDSDARFKVVVCGRRWGKSMLAVVILMLEALNNPDGLYWYIAPTYKQAKNIAWRFLMSRIRLFPKAWQDKCRIQKNDLIIELPNHAIIELKGAQEPDTLVGSGLNGVVLDEYAIDAYGNAPVWAQAIRPALSDKGGWGLFISTPRGYNHFWNRYDEARTNADGTWAAFQMPTSTNPYINTAELEAARREVGEDMFSQEYLAEFRKKSGLVYKEFDRDIHVIPAFKDNEISDRWTLEVGIDFGASHPTAAIFVLFDHVDDTAYIVDEHYEAEMHTEDHVSAIKAKEDYWLGFLRKKRAKRVGDSQAKQSLLDYAKHHYYVTPTLKGAGSVDVGISAVRQRLINDIITGRPKLLVTEDCPNTIREFENYSWMRQGGAVETDEMMQLATKGKDAPRKIFDDAMDAARYVIQYHAPHAGHGTVTRRASKRNPLVGI